MEPLHIIPAWFLGLNTTFEIIFVIFTALIAFYSFKIYRISRQRESRIFGLSFLFLSLSYASIIVANILFLCILRGGFCTIEIGDIISLKNLFVLLYLSFLVLGFITLFYTTLKSKNTRLYFLLLFLSLTSIFYSADRSLSIYFISSLFLLLIGIHYFKQYSLIKNKNTLYVAIGISLIFISNVLMGFVGNYTLPNLYVISSFLEIAGYIFIVSSLIKVLKNGKKTK